MDRNQRLLALIRELRSLYRELYRARPRDFAPAPGLSRPQLELIFALGERTDGMTMTELADTLQVTKAAVTQLVDQLVDKGLVLRNQNPADRRSVLITVARPTRALPSFDAYYTEHVSPMFDALTDRELEQFAALMRKIGNGEDER